LLEQQPRLAVPGHLRVGLGLAGEGTGYFWVVILW
jgi:hypothetical protein